MLRVSQSRASTKGRVLHATFVLARRILGEEVKFPACLAVLFIICQSGFARQLEGDPRSIQQLPKIIVAKEVLCRIRVSKQPKSFAVSLADKSEPSTSTHGRALHLNTLPERHLFGNHN